MKKRKQRKAENILKTLKNNTQVKQNNNKKIPQTKAILKGEKTKFHSPLD